MGYRFQPGPEDGQREDGQRADGQPEIG
jgi:hypothetical protein